MDPMIICILGRQPRLGAAELESLYGADRVRLLSGGIGQRAVLWLDRRTKGHPGWRVLAAKIYAARAEKPLVED